jgi:hypothetical protein
LRIGISLLTWRAAKACNGSKRERRGLRRGHHFNNNRTFVAAHRLANFEPIMQSVRDLNKLDD